MKWKDYVIVVAIVLVVIGIAIALTGIKVDWRIMSLLLLLLGTTMYMVLGPRELPKRTGWYVATNSLSSAIVICFLGLVFNTPILYVVAGLGLIALWSIILADHLGMLQYKPHHHYKPRHH